MAENSHGGYDLGDSASLSDFFRAGVRRQTYLLIANSVFSLAMTMFIFEMTSLFASPYSSLHRILLPEGGISHRIVPVTIILAECWSLFFIAERILWLRRERRILDQPDLAATVKEVAGRGGRAVGRRSVRGVRDILKGVFYERLVEICVLCDTRGDVYQLVKDRMMLNNDRLIGEYNMNKMLILAMPILGFIGTVLGVSLAIGDFSLFLHQSGGQAELAMIKERLADIASSLAYAFDSTLLGLGACLVAMATTSVTQTWEERFLTRVDELCLEIMATAPAGATGTTG